MGRDCETVVRNPVQFLLKGRVGLPHLPPTTAPLESWIPGCDSTLLLKCLI